MEGSVTPSNRFIAKFVGSIVSAVFVLVAAAAWGCPTYRVWQQRLEGEAELARAQYSKQVAIQEANAKNEAAKALAEAEITRARGVAEANKIIGQSLHDNEAYLRYLWIHSLEEGKAEVIYVPTEANLPILEAARRAPVAVQQP
jgi:predicted aminopeptidase